MPPVGFEPKISAGERQGRSNVKVKVKFDLEQTMKAQKGRRGKPLIFNLGGRWGWVVNATPRPLYPRERDPAPIVQEAGWDPGPARTGAEYLDPTRIRSPDRPARSESLY